MMSHSQFIKRSEKYFKSYDSMLRRNCGTYFLGIDNNIGGSYFDYDNKYQQVRCLFKGYYFYTR